MVKYILACRQQHASNFVDTNISSLNKKLALLKINEKTKWYDDGHYACLMPFMYKWFRYNYTFWWDVVDTKYPNQVQLAIKEMEAVVRKEDLYIVHWLKHWATKGAFFILVGE
jgi:hypothetical protein